MKRTRATLARIVKRFGDFTALDGVDFDLRIGEVHALVGENGAGKSTLMRILAGQLDATEGDLSLARATKVAFVEQEGGLIPELTGAENLVLRDVGTVVARTRAAQRRIAVVASKLGQNVDASVPAGSLEIGSRQRLEIMIALASGADVLILDEPTAAMGPEDAAILRDTVHRFVDDGGSVVYISHKLGEVAAIANRVTVMRRGKVVAHYDRMDDVSVNGLARDMIGEVKGAASDLVDVILTHRETVVVDSDAPVVASLQDVVVRAPRGTREELAGASLTVRAGEILGVAGVVGSGQTLLSEVLTGIRTVDDGKITRANGPIGYIAENRRKDSVAQSLPVVANMMVHAYSRPEFGRVVLRADRSDEFVQRLVDESHVALPSIHAPISALSGGNQQRAVVGRELERDPVLIVAHNPFRGLDVRAIHDVREALLSAARRGAGVVLISPDLDELLPLSSRIAVLYAGRIVGDVDPLVVTEEQLGLLMGGEAA